MPVNYYYLDHGDALLRKGKTQQAIAIYEQGLACNNNDSQLHESLGIAYSGLRKLREAAGEYEQAVKLDPENERLHLMLGGILHQLGQGERAIAECKAAIALNRKNPLAYFLLGGIYDEQEDYRSAVVQFCQALNLSPDDFQANLRLGRCRVIMREADEAIPALLTAIRLNPKASLPHQCLASAYFLQVKPGSAACEFCKAIILQPTKWHNYGLLLKCLIYMLRNGQFR